MWWKRKPDRLKAPTYNLPELGLWNLCHKQYSLHGVWRNRFLQGNLHDPPVFSGQNFFFLHELHTLSKDRTYWGQRQNYLSDINEVIPVSSSVFCREARYRNTVQEHTSSWSLLSVFNSMDAVLKMCDHVLCLTQNSTLARVRALEFLRAICVYPTKAFIEGSWSDSKPSVFMWTPHTFCPLHNIYLL